MLPYGLHFTSITWSTEKKSEVGTKEKENEEVGSVDVGTDTKLEVRGVWKGVTLRKRSNWSSTWSVGETTMNWGSHSRSVQYGTAAQQAPSKTR